jgi:hypothetical protein
MHGGHSEVARGHFRRQPLHLAARAAVDDGLRDGQRVVQVAQRAELPLLLLHGDVELADALQRELVAAHQDLHRLAH